MEDAIAIDGMEAVVEVGTGLRAVRGNPWMVFLMGPLWFFLLL